MPKGNWKNQLMIVLFPMIGIVLPLACLAIMYPLGLFATKYFENALPYSLAIAHLFAAVLGAASIFVYLAYIHKKYGREEYSSYHNEYEQQPPYDYPPAYVGALMNEMHELPLPRDFLATIFYLKNLGYIELEKAGKDYIIKIKKETGPKITSVRIVYDLLVKESIKAEGKLSFSQIRDETIKEHNWFNSFFPHWAYLVRDEVNRMDLLNFSREGLARFELLVNIYAGIAAITVLSIVSCGVLIRVPEEYGRASLYVLMGGGIVGTLTILAIILSSILIWTYVLAKIIELATSGLQVLIKSIRKGKVDYKNFDKLLISIVLIPILTAIFFAFGGDAYIGNLISVLLPVTPFSFFFFGTLFGIGLRRYAKGELLLKSSKGNLHFKRWKAFRRYVRDFSNMEDHPPLHVHLWDQILTYSISLGIAENVLNKMEHVFPEENKVRDGKGKPAFSEEIRAYEGITKMIEAFSIASTVGIPEKLVEYVIKSEEDIN
ncbi:DUF2207 domain-containing protein [archaeon]|nr:DUF2207 domain-containing protein [archaeon]